MDDDTIFEPSPSFSRSISAETFAKLKSSPIKDAVAKLNREKPYLNTTYLRARMIDHDTVKVELGGINESRPFCDELHKIFKDENPTEENSPSIVREEPFTVSRQDAKDFFGKEVVMTADELNRPISRVIFIGRTL